MKLFAKGKGGPNAPSGPAAAFQPIDRTGLLGLLDQVVNSGQSGVLELQEPRGAWVYGFQAGALTHASGGRVRGARQAFDLLWEFQQGQFKYVPGNNQGLASNLYIDKARLLEMLRRSQAALRGPASPYIPADQQRALPQYPTGPAAAPAWAQQQPSAPGPANGAPGWAPRAYPPAPAGYPQAAPPGYPPQPPAAYPQPPNQPPAYPQPPRQPAAYPQPFPPQSYPSQGQPAQPAPPPAQPLARQPARPVTPPSFSVPPMPIPRKAPAQPAARVPAALPAPPAPAPAEAPKGAPVDDLKALRASLVAQVPAAGAPPGPAWKVRTADGAVPAAAVPVPKAAGGARVAKAGKAAKAAKATRAGSKKKSALGGALELRLIKFLLWACERSYSADDHWTLKDAFEVSTMELRDQFVGAFSQSFKVTPKTGVGEDEVDELAAGRMRGRAKSRKR
jgi:hypothetical protein